MRHERPGRIVHPAGMVHDDSPTRPRHSRVHHARYHLLRLHATEPVQTDAADVAGVADGSRHGVQVRQCVCVNASAVSTGYNTPSPRSRVSFLLVKCSAICDIVFVLVTFSVADVLNHRIPTKTLSLSYSK